MPRPLSTNSRHVRKRIRDSGKDLMRDVGILYKKPLDQWDFEELQRGRPREPDGTFKSGRRPSWIDPVMMAEVRRRLKTEARDRLGEYTDLAINGLAMLLTDEETDDNGKPLTSSGVKFQIATYILDQVIGKSTAQVEISGSSDLQKLLARIMVNDDGEDAHPIVEGSVAGEEDEDDDDE